MPNNSLDARRGGAEFVVYFFEISACREPERSPPKKKKTADIKDALKGRLLPKHNGIFSYCSC